jgi:DNA replication protein DnaC
MSNNGKDHDPTVVTVEQFYANGMAEHISEAVEENRHRAAETAERVPTMYRGATVTDSGMRAWTVGLIRDACDLEHRSPAVRTGIGVRLLGIPGVGKTHQAYGMLRAMLASGVRCSWIAIPAPDLYSKLKPQPGVNSEAEYERFAKVSLLVLDDLGTAKPSEWNEEVNYRLFNYRAEWQKPTVVTSNLSMPELGHRLGERVKSRLVGMTIQITMEGPDRRRQL